MFKRFLTIFCLLVWAAQAAADHESSDHDSQGAGTSQSLTRASYERAAQRGDPVGQFNLGVLYAQGAGVDRDPVKAAEWYRRAADSGYAAAQFNLALLYATGEGVPKDAREAAAWYRKAAEHGLPQAQVNLAMLYYAGEGVPKDDGEAAAWFAKAARQGDDNARRALEILGRPGDLGGTAAIGPLFPAANPIGTPLRLESAGAAASLAVEPEVVGTGFLVSPDGLLVTSGSLVEAAKGKALRVFLPDGRIAEPEVVNTAPASDLAVLRVGLPTPSYLELVDAGDGPKSGDKVLALAFLASELKSGAPKVAKASVLRAHRSKARGVVFAVDVPRERGTAGAPILDERGRVIGMLPRGNETTIPLTGRGPRGGGEDVTGAAEIRALLPNLPKPAHARDASRAKLVTRARQALCLVVTLPSGPPTSR